MPIAGPGREGHGWRSRGMIRLRSSGSRRTAPPGPSAARPPPAAIVPAKLADFPPGGPTGEVKALVPDIVPAAAVVPAGLVRPADLGRPASSRGSKKPFAQTAADEVHPGRGPAGRKAPLLIADKKNQITRTGPKELDALSRGTPAEPSPGMKAAQARRGAGLPDRSGRPSGLGKIYRERLRERHWTRTTSRSAASSRARRGGRGPGESRPAEEDGSRSSRPSAGSRRRTRSWTKSRPWRRKFNT